MMTITDERVFFPEKMSERVSKEILALYADPRWLSESCTAQMWTAHLMAVELIERRERERWRALSEEPRIGIDVVLNTNHGLRFAIFLATGFRIFGKGKESDIADTFRILQWRPLPEPPDA